MSDLRMVFEIVGNESASPAIRKVETSLDGLESQARKTGESLKASLGADFAKSLKADVTAATELRDVLQQVAAVQRSMQAAGRTTRTTTAAAGTTEARQVTQAASARARAAATADRTWGAQQRRRVSIMDRSAATTARAAQADTRRRAAAFTRRLRDLRYLAGVREKSERAETKHLDGVRRAHAAIRRDALRSARGVASHGAHAARSLSHPYFSSPAFAATAGAAFGVEASRKIIDATLSIDTAAVRYRMFAAPPGADGAADTAKARKAALLASVGMGIDADKILDIQAKAVRDGVTPEIARTLPKSIAAAAQVMGGGQDVERLTDSLAEGVQQGVAMGWLKSPKDARRFLNTEAGLSNFAGNSAEKQEQFVAAGGLGHGKEMGLDSTGSMAYGAMLNASGARTGLASARFMGQLSQNTPKMTDKYRAAIDSHTYTQEDRAVREAPRSLGYGSIQNMQTAIMGGPEGLIDFATRLQTLDDKTRKLTLEGYGFSEQGGAMLAEIGAGPAKSKAILARAKELSEQSEADDYLTSKFKDWQTSLSFMLKQIEAGWRSIESEVGDVLKGDIIEPIRNWWVLVSAAILNSGMKSDVHAAIIGFVNGLGFADVKALLDNLSASAKGFDVGAFFKGLGEGIRTVVTAIRNLFGVLSSIVGSGDAETVGRLSAELFGFALAAHAIAPAVAIIGSLAAAFLALKSALQLGLGLAELTGLTAGIQSLTALDLAGGAAGLVSFAGGLAALVGVIGLANREHALEMPKGLSGRDFMKFLDPGLANRIYGPEFPEGRTKDDQAASHADKSQVAPDAAMQGLMQLNSYRGEGFGNLLTQASYSPSDSGEIVRDAILGTERAVIDLRNIMQRNATMAQLAALGTGNMIAGYGGGGGSGGGVSNLRYGRNAAGGRNSTPGTGSFGNPSKSLLDFIAQSEGGGYNVSQGNGKFLPGGIVPHPRCIARIVEGRLMDQIALQH